MAERSEQTQEDQDVHEPNLRSVFEFFLGLLIAMSLLRAFVAEAYLVPTGSMAPSLLGYHTQTVCPDCGHLVIVGTNTEGNLDGVPVCNNCGRRLDYSGLPVIPGDRLLVHKWLYGYRQPRRWETIVFACPDHPQQAYVKRVVGLPGESVQIRRGNVFINGEIARKSLAEFENLAVLVHEHQQPGDRPLSRWVPQKPASSWVVDAAALHFLPTQEQGVETPADFVFYQHRDADGKATHIVDETEYTVARPRWQHSDVFDLLLKCRLEIAEPTGSVIVVLQPVGSRKFHLELDYRSSAATLTWNDEVVQTAELPRDRRSLDVTFGYFDERVVVRLGPEGDLPPFDLPLPLGENPTLNSTPFAIGSCGQQVRVESVRIFRDVHYSSRIAGTYKPSGVVKPYKLAEDEYFVLGDNSAISHDSRAWDRPAVPARLLVGKPVFVHLPSQGWQLELFGRKFRRPLPDVTKIRRIH